MQWIKLGSDTLKHKKKNSKKKIKRKLRANDFVDQLLVKCKDHGGPFTSVQEAKEVASKKPSELKTYLRQEIQYQRVTHQRDAEARKIFI